MRSENLLSRKRQRIQSRVLWLSGVLLVLACDVFPFPIFPPQGMTAVVGGISDVRPYFGKLRNSMQQEIGDFMLATCGCGDWRMLMSLSDGSPQIQFPVRFYVSGEYDPTAVILVYGSDEHNLAQGDVDQSQGTLSGVTNLGYHPARFDAVRGNAHAQEIQACVMCHIGSDPIWPQPPGHTPYVPGVTDCFNCHTVNIQ